MKRSKSIRIFQKMISLLILSAFCLPVFSQDGLIGKTSVPILNFPWGARSLAMGETFTGIANDEQALFYNPAGLGLSPLAKTWKHYSPSSTPRFTAIAGGMRNQRDVWALSDEGGIYRFNGVDWVDYFTHTVDTNDIIWDIAAKYALSENRQEIDDVVRMLKSFNNMYPRERRRISRILAKDLPQNQADSLADYFAFLPNNEITRIGIMTHLLEIFDNDEASALAEEISEVLRRTFSAPFSGIFELKIPYTIALRGKINSINTDATGRLWVAGDEGLWRFDNEWRRFTSLDGIPNDIILNSVVQLPGGDIALATNKGAYIFENGVFRKITGEHELFDGDISYVLRIDNNTYLGTNQGLLTITNGVEALVDSSHGLVSNVVRVVATDSRQRIWVGGDDGIAVFNGMEWQRFRFANSRVFDIAFERDRRIWFATDNGAVEYLENRDGSVEWKVHHERNNLNSSVINSAIFHRGDVWLATDNGVSRLQSGQIRATMFWENLLPSLHLDDMWHAAVAATFPIGEWGTFGVSFNQLYYGDIETWSADNTIEAVYPAFEFVVGLSYGMRLRRDFATGITLKYFYSRLKKDESETQSFAVDLGLLRQNFLTRDLTLGFSLLNMGPAVQYSQESLDPIPFAMRLGASYKPIRRATHHLLVALDLEREIAYVDEDGPAPFFRAFYMDLLRDEATTWREKLSKVTLHTGLEFNYLDFIVPRLGWMYDKAGLRNEVNVGIGLSVNMIAADFGIIFTLGENTIRQNQMRFSITYAR